MPSPRLSAAKARIVAHFRRRRRRILSHKDLERLVGEKRQAWRLPVSMPVRKVVAFLLGSTELKRVALDFPSRREVRYCWGDASPYALALSLRPNAYLSHYTAMGFHDLTDQIPRVVYLNAEQRPKSLSPGGLQQERIDTAFKRKPRRSSNVASHGGFRICILNGKHTGGMGVAAIRDEQGSPIRLTGLERTLIDIVVRPFYAGGVFEVLEAYRRAGGSADVAGLVRMLRRLDHVYPYHQAMGFYMEKAGTYTSRELSMLGTLGAEYDFYLTYQMSRPLYSRRWRLFFPKGF